MIYLESIVFGASKNRNQLCILNWKLSPQLCKNLGKCPFLCIMNISLQNSKLQGSAYFFCCCCCTQNFSLFCTVELLSYKSSFPMRKYIPYQIPLNSSLYVIFPLLQGALLQYCSCFTLQLDLIYEVECVAHLLYIMNKRTAFFRQYSIQLVLYTGIKPFIHTSSN